MKKLVKILAVLFAAGIFFVSCSKEEKSKGLVWFDTLEDGLEAAKKQDKRIFLHFTSFDDDGISKRIKDSLLDLPEFAEENSQEFVFVNLDFSKSLFEKAFNPQTQNENADSGANEELAKKLSANARSQRNYGVSAFPTTFVLSKEGYVIKEIDLFDRNESFKADENDASSLVSEEAVRPLTLVEYKAVLKDLKESFKLFDELLEKTKSSELGEMVKAVENLYTFTAVQSPDESTDYCYPLKELSQKIVDTDKENKSGEVGKHFLILAKYEAQDLLSEDKFLEASEVWSNASKNAVLTAEEKQAALVQAGFTLATGGSTNYAKMIEYFDAAIATAPDSDSIAQIESLKSLVEQTASGTVSESSEPGEQGEFAPFENAE
ncbi:hypothetical protein [Treponema zioleckii]|uniref:hypothetical protein n=1 Tax=Treponema zioleckii TaxID=331680 RepID=UPI00168BCA28|nr:hypothetical protein [Treponema zioleckii]